MNYIFAHVMVLTRTITDVYEMPMKFQSGFCKISLKKDPVHFAKVDILANPTSKQERRPVAVLKLLKLSNLGHK
jgi:hypothetical protein